MNAKRTLQLSLLALGLVGSTAACQNRQIELTAAFGAKSSERLAARAVLAPIGGTAVKGDVALSELVTAHTTAHPALPEVMAYAHLAGLEAKPYTVRIHNEGSCDLPSATGDTGPNARAVAPDANGEVNLSASLLRASLQDGDAYLLVGKTMVVHEGTAATGTPVACGVIARAAAADEHHGAAPAAGHEAAPAAGHEAAPAAGHEGEAAGH